MLSPLETELLNQNSVITITVFYSQEQLGLPDSFTMNLVSSSEPIELLTHFEKVYSIDSSVYDNVEGPNSPQQKVLLSLSSPCLSSYINQLTISVKDRSLESLQVSWNLHAQDLQHQQTVLLSSMSNMMLSDTITLPLNLHSASFSDYQFSYVIHNYEEIYDKLDVTLSYFSTILTSSSLYQTDFYILYSHKSMVISSLPGTLYHSYSISPSLPDQFLLDSDSGSITTGPFHHSLVGRTVQYTVSTAEMSSSVITIQYKGIYQHINVESP